MRSSSTKIFAALDYDLAATLTSGQAFRWRQQDESWVGVIQRHWVRLIPGDGIIRVETGAPVSDWQWLTRYLQLDLELEAVLRAFPDDAPMRAAVAACRGLRLLRQDPWECLASFILSSTKQIIQIQEIVSLICDRYGEPLGVPAGNPILHSFPTPGRLAEASESDLRECKMGFRAPYLLTAARSIANGELDLVSLAELSIEEARTELLRLPGVGRKISDCVLLFAYGKPAAFPVDVWVMKALRQLYFPGRQVSLRQLHRFAADHFGPQAGYAQQYLFHYTRMKGI